MKIEKNDLSFYILAFMIICTLTLRKFKILIYISQALFILFCIKEKKIYINKMYLFSRFIFFILTIASFIWSVSKKSYLGEVLAIVQISILCTIFSGKIRNLDEINKILKIFSIASLVLIINLLISTSASEWKKIIYYSSSSYVNVSSGAGRLGMSIGYHPNAFGGLVIVLLLCNCYNYSLKKEKKYLFLIVGLFALLVLSKSRSSLIAAFVGIFVFYISSQKNVIKKVFRITTAIIAIIVILWAILNIPIIYKLVGYRVEGILNLFTTNSDADASTLTRIDFIKIAFEIFLDKPIVGAGLNNFSYIAYNEYSIWGEVYAHNNYAELLADFGIIGFYFYYYVLIKSMFNIYRYKNNKKISKNYFLLNSFMFSMLTMSLILDISQVTYYHEFIQFMHVILICYSSICNMYIKDIKINTIS